MKKIISVLALAAVSLTLLAGCSKKSDSIFDYKASDYVTLDKVVGVEYTYDLQETTDEIVQAYINEKLSDKGYGETKTTKDRAAKNGDTVNIDFEGLLNGVAFEGGTAQGYELKLGSNSFIEGFEAGLVGVKPGQKVALDLKFPDPYQNNPDLAGKPVVFNVTLNHIKETVYPELTDKIVKELSADKNTVAEYMAYAKEQVDLELKLDAEDEKQGEIWNTIVYSAKLDKYPDAVVEKYKNLIFNLTSQNVQNQYGMSYEDLLKQQNMTREDIEPELLEQAKMTVKNYLVIIEIAKQYDLEPTESEYEAAYGTYATQYGYTDVAKFLEAVDKEQLKLEIMYERVLDYVVENAIEKK